MVADDPRLIAWWNPMPHQHSSKESRLEAAPIAGFSQSFYSERMSSYFFVVLLENSEQR
jgi:hypothetical protein